MSLVPVLPPMLQSAAADDIFKAAAARSDPRYASIPAGESAGLISDLPSARDVVRRIVDEADRVTHSL